MLQIKFKEGFGQPVDLVPPGCTLGRGRVNDMVIDDASVDSFHADIKVTSKMATIEDTGSLGGTFVNGRKVITPASLKAGDTIRVGNVELEVVSKLKKVKIVELDGAGLIELGSGSWSLRAQTGPDSGETMTVPGKMVIGRSSDCDLSIFDPGLSRRHAELELIGDRLLIRDLGSANGTYVNEERVTEKELADGDQIRFDRLMFTVNAPK